MRCGDELITETEAGEGILANDTNKDGYAETARQKSPASTALKLGLFRLLRQSWADWLPHGGTEELWANSRIP